MGTWGHTSTQLLTALRWFRGPLMVFEGPRWTYVLPVVAALCLSVGYNFLQQRSAKAAHVHDSASMFSPGLQHFVLLLQLQLNGPLQGASPEIARLDKIVEKHGGRLTYLGKCLQVHVQTSQFHLPTCDVVAHTTWVNATYFEGFRTEISTTWAVHKVQAFDRPTLMNIGVAVVFHGLLPLILRAKAAFFGATWSDLSVQSTQPEKTEGAKKNAMGISQYEEWVSLHKFGDLLDAGDPEQPVVVWNFECAIEGPSTQSQYAMDVVPAFVSAGGGPIHVGPVQDKYQGKDGDFDTFGAIYYPSRQFVSQFVRSQYMLDAIKNKNPGDGLVVATVPYVWP